jgi:hypothetical protein
MSLVLWPKGSENQRFVGWRYEGPEPSGHKILRLVYVNPFGARIWILAGHSVGQMDPYPSAN